MGRVFVRRFPVRTWIFQPRGMDEGKEEGQTTVGYVLALHSHSPNVRASRFGKAIAKVDL